MRIITIFLLIIVYSCFSSSYAQSSYEDLINHSADSLEVGNYMAAEQILIEAMKKEPTNKKNALLLSSLGTIQVQLKKYDEALLSFNAALVKHPKKTSVLHNRASLYSEIDSINKALEDYDTILSLKKDDIEALYKRGLIYLGKKEVNKAEIDFQSIELISPKNLFGQMGIALVMKKRKEWLNAENLYSDLLYENRTNAELYPNRAECYIEQDKLGRAQEDLNKAQTYGYETSLLYIIKGQLKLRQFDKGGAKQSFMRAKELGANSKLIDELIEYCKQ